MFNEQTLRSEIAKVWGEHGAHMDVYDELLKRAALSNPKEPETVHGNEAGKGGIQKKFCEVCSQETYHDSHGCLGTSFG